MKGLNPPPPPQNVLIVLAEEDWHMPIESSQYFIILFRVNQVFTFYHFIIDIY